jgi:hypothetical protein
MTDVFLCPRRRAGLFDPATRSQRSRSPTFLCPRCRAGLFDRRSYLQDARVPGEFLCPRCRAGHFDERAEQLRAELAVVFLCPRCRAGLFDDPNVKSGVAGWICFYALGVGLGFSTVARITSRLLRRFLCPRCRAGLFDASTGEPHALGHGVSMPSVSGWAFRPQQAGEQLRLEVSMPSVSGWAFRRMPCGGARDLRFRCPFRHPVGSVSAEEPFPARFEKTGP